MKLTKIASAILLSSALAACGGNSSKSTNDGNPVITPSITPSEEPAPVTNQNIDGQLVVPVSLTTSARAAIKPIQSRDTSCPDVPDGYMPLNGATVQLRDVAGNTVSEDVITDICGKFVFVVPDSLVSSIEKVVANKEGFRQLISDVENFLASNASKVVSTVENDAKFVLSGFRKTSNNSINFIITDSKSKKAVLGLPTSSFQFSLDSQAIAAKKITGSQNIAGDSTSLAITLDASGSMSVPVLDSNGNFIPASDSNPHTRYSLVASSTHQLIDMTKANDPDAEIAVTLFSTTIYSMTDSTIAQYLQLFDNNDTEIQYSINSTTGFVKDVPTLHTLIDLYNPHSDIYDPYFTPVASRHPDRTDNIHHASWYPFGGGTAFYDSIDAAITQLANANVAKPMIVALTDGSDNNSSNSADDIIAKANQYNIPVNIIAASDSFDQTSVDAMKKIASNTGSEYFDVTNLADLGGFLSGISTRVTFNYNADFNETFASGQKLTISLTASDGSVITYPEQVIP
ncbi:hypothetical protein Q4519_14310 [Motilimonas sp. 1_MG-2023]|uniref:hypothetical protein n=1 Tax=Motilimonas sp. 1_MG-2023 TaxID=3062672 RepID=UPI0026E36F2B|nr:hypothetical protein [Motilimonas sp. 1_MG-2023]MDO6526858.1 hypothetical protein [Motilimonas sp. 1_MG-2023]